MENVINSLGFQTELEKKFPPYQVDCYIPELSIVVEIDGIVHGKGGKSKGDTKRDLYLIKNYKVGVMRIKNDIVNSKSFEELKEFISGLLGL